MTDVGPEALMAKTSTHITPADWRETGRTRCGRPFTSLPGDCPCGSPQCTNTVEADAAMTGSAASGNPAPDGICTPCWNDLRRETAADGKSEFRLPDGAWSCVRDGVTEPCGDCDGCRQVAAINAAADRCPDCGRAECTGEDCYWPDEAGLR